MVYTLVSGFFHSVQCLRDLSTLLHVSVVCSFLLLSGIPLHEYTSLWICSSHDIKLGYFLCFFLLWINLWTFLCMSCKWFFNTWFHSCFSLSTPTITSTLHDLYLGCYHSGSCFTLESYLLFHENIWAIRPESLQTLVSYTCTFISFSIRRTFGLFHSLSINIFWASIMGLPRQPRCSHNLTTASPSQSTHSPQASFSRPESRISNWPLDSSSRMLHRHFKIIGVHLTGSTSYIPCFSEWKHSLPSHLRQNPGLYPILPYPSIPPSK